MPVACVTAHLQTFIVVLSWFSLVQWFSSSSLLSPSFSLSFLSVFSLILLLRFCLLLVLDLPLSVGFICATQPIPENKESAIVSHVVAVMKVMLVRATCHVTLERFLLKKFGNVSPSSLISSLPSLLSSPSFSFPSLHSPWIAGTKFHGLRGKWYPECASNVSHSRNTSHNSYSNTWAPKRIGPATVGIAFANSSSTYIRVRSGMCTCDNVWNAQCFFLCFAFCHCWYCHSYCLSLSLPIAATVTTCSVTVTTTLSTPPVTMQYHVHATLPSLSSSLSPALLFSPSLSSLLHLFFLFTRTGCAYSEAKPIEILNSWWRLWMYL